MQSVKTKISVGGSSFLNNRSKSWKNLKENYDLKFLNYANVREILTEEQLERKVFWCECLNDHIDGYYNYLSTDNIDKYISYVVSIFQQRSELTKHETVVFLSSNEDTPILSNVREESMYDYMYFQTKKRLLQLSKDTNNFFILDLNKEFAKYGTQALWSDRNWYFARCRYKEGAFSIISEVIEKFLYRSFYSPKKVLALDCDNTLWGGVVGEEGLSGILVGSDGLGAAFKDFQKEVKNIQRLGVLIVLLSKNNIKDVREVFAKNTEMVLTWQDISAHAINWNEKSKNLSSIANDLGLGVESFVFWDDSYVERGKMEAAHKDVLTVNVSNDVTLWPGKLRNLFEFTKISVTSEDLAKSRQYLEKGKFESAKSKSSSAKEFLRSINMRPSIEVLSKDNSERAFQLSQKTNQFNLTLERHSKSDLSNFVKNNQYFCCITKLKDDFSDHGRVGLFCLQDDTKKSLLIQNLLLSCRVLGREYEFWVMQQLLEIAWRHNYLRVVARFKKGDRNHACANFLEDCGFSRLYSNVDGDFYELTQLAHKKLGDLYERRIG